MHQRPPTIPRDDRRRDLLVSADLSRDWSAPLLAAGLDPGQKIAWLAEGLLIYLDHHETERLLTTITTLSAAGSTLALEAGGIATAQFMKSTRRLSDMASFNALQNGGLETDTAGWLHSHGWNAIVHDGADLAHQHQRSIPNEAAGTFLVATRVTDGRPSQSQLPASSPPSERANPDTIR